MKSIAIYILCILVFSGNIFAQSESASDTSQPQTAESQSAAKNPSSKTTFDRTQPLPRQTEFVTANVAGALQITGSGTYTFRLDGNMSVNMEPRTTIASAAPNMAKARTADGWHYNNVKSLVTVAGKDVQLTLQGRVSSFMGRGNGIMTINGSGIYGHEEQRRRLTSSNVTVQFGRIDRRSRNDETRPSPSTESAPTTPSATESAGAEDKKPKSTGDETVPRYGSPVSTSGNFVRIVCEGSVSFEGNGTFTANLRGDLQVSESAKIAIPEGQPELNKQQTDSGVLYENIDTDLAVSGSDVNFSASGRIGMLQGNGSGTISIKGRGSYIVGDRQASIPIEGVTIQFGKETPKSK